MATELQPPSERLVRAAGGLYLAGEWREPEGADRLAVHDSAGL